jgi:hypothetical protein
MRYITVAMPDFGLGLFNGALLTAQIAIARD